MQLSILILQEENREICKVPDYRRILPGRKYNCMCSANLLDICHGHLDFSE